MYPTERPGETPPKEALLRRMGVDEGTQPDAWPVVYRGTISVAIFLLPESLRWKY